MILCDNCSPRKGCTADKNRTECRFYQPITEQEYLQTCTTEQLAEFIVNLTLLDKYKLYDRMEAAEYENGIGVGAKKVIVEWLEQPHTTGGGTK